MYSHRQALIKILLNPTTVLALLALIISIYLGLPIVYFLLTSVDLTLKDSQLIRATEISVAASTISTIITFLTIVPLIYLISMSRHRYISRFVFF
jgi:ABC-type sulfate transport system permease component